MSVEPGGRGSQQRSPDLYKETVADSAEQAEGRFGRLFTIGETELRSDNSITRLRPHPSPRYDLERLGRKDGPMKSAVSNQQSNTPAGITFLGQFIDHDITLDVQSKFENPGINSKLENGRTPNLDLDCMYGGGREASPHLYTGPYLLEGQETGMHGSVEVSDL